MSALALSVVLSLVSAVAYAAGAIVQERVAESSPEEQYAPLRRPGWWAAVALNGLGGLLHVVALAYGPLSLVQPLGALTIVVALPMAALFVGRKAGATAWRGAIMATIGLAGLLSLVGAADAQSLNTPQRIGAAVVTAGAVVALMVAGRAAHRHPAVRSMLLATGSGIAFGMSSVFTKTVAVDWSDGVSAADVPSLAVIGVLATAGMLLSQAAYRGAGLAAPLATLTVVNPVVAAAVGITMFGETFRYGMTGTVLALGCAVVAAGGLILLTTERLAAEQHGTASAPSQAPVAVPVPVSGDVSGSVSGAISGSVLGSVSGPVPGSAGAVAEPAGAVPAVGASAVGQSAVGLPAGGGRSVVRDPVSRELVSRELVMREPVLRASGVDRSSAEKALAEKALAGASLAGRLEEALEGIRNGTLVPAQAAEEPSGVLVPARPPAGEPVAVAADGPEPPPLYGPFYGGTYVSAFGGATPVLDRHRVRIKS